MGPVLQAVVGDVEQAERGAGCAGGTHATVLVKAEEQLLQSAGQKPKGSVRIQPCPRPEAEAYLLCLSIDLVIFP